MRKLFLGAVLLLCLMQVSVVFAYEEGNCCPRIPMEQPTSAPNSCGIGKFILDKNSPETCKRCAGSQQCGEGATYNEEACTCTCDSGKYRCKSGAGGSMELICCSEDQCLTNDHCSKDRPYCNMATSGEAISCTTCVECYKDAHCSKNTGTGKTSCLYKGEGAQNPRCVCPWKNGIAAAPTGSECCTSVGGTWADGTCCVGSKKITKVKGYSMSIEKETNETCCKKAGGTMKDGKCCKCPPSGC